MHKIHRFFLAAFAATFFLFGSQASMASKPSIGFVLVGPHNDGGWSMRCLLYTSPSPRDVP